MSRFVVMGIVFAIAIIAILAFAYLWFDRRAELKEKEREREFTRDMKMEEQLWDDGGPGESDLDDLVDDPVYDRPTEDALDDPLADDDDR